MAPRHTAAPRGRERRRALRRAAATAVAIASGLAATVAGAAPAQAGTSVEVSTVLALINEDRESLGAPPLRLAADVSAAAEAPLHAWIAAGGDSSPPFAELPETATWKRSGSATGAAHRGAAGQYLFLTGENDRKRSGWFAGALADPTVNAVGIGAVRDAQGALWLGLEFVDYSGDQIIAPEPVRTARFDGVNRYATAAEVATFHHPAPETVIIVSGDKMADAVSAGPLARELGAPIILVPPGNHGDGITRDLKAGTYADPATRPFQYLVHADPQRVIIVGGPTVVDPDWDRVALAGNATVERIYGANRYETSAKVAARPEFSGAGRFFVTTGQEANLADAVSAGGAAGALHMPILLMEQSGPNAAAHDFLRQRPRDAFALGGILSDTAVSSVGAARISGADRYETSRLIATWAAQQGVRSDELTMAAGTALPDALVAGALGRITLLTPPQRWSEQTSAWVRDHGVASIVAVGGRTPTA